MGNSEQAKLAQVVETTQLCCAMRNYEMLGWCPGAGSNHRHCDFQSHALPTELPGRATEGPRKGPASRRFIVGLGGCVYHASPSSTRVPATPGTTAHCALRSPSGEAGPKP